MRLKRLAEQPAEHCLYGVSMRWMQFNKEAPQEMDEEELENWLWKENESLERWAASSSDDP
jgi:hypothetical protein